MSRHELSRHGVALRVVGAVAAGLVLVTALGGAGASAQPARVVLSRESAAAAQGQRSSGRAAAALWQHPSRTATATAQQRASAARARVSFLLDEYTAASQRVNVQVAALSRAFAQAAAADVDSGAAAAQERRAQAFQREQVRAVYASGGMAGLKATVLAATTPDDALWRASTADRVLAVILADTRSRVQQQAGAASLARRRAQQAGAAADQQARALEAGQQAATAAAKALQAARRTLGALDRAARRARAAQETARRIAAAQAAARAASRAAMGQVSALAIPAEYAAAYRAAARTCPGMPWTLLAGVGQVESGHGRNNGPSSAGAIGPMQFLPATFAGYAVDGDGDGVLDAWDPQDAIFTAAHYLCVSGASGGSAAGIHAALLAYNHAEWYVDLVLAAEQAISRQAAGH